MFTALLVIYILIAITVVGLILVQQGKGVHVSSSFANASTGSSLGTGLTRVTTIFAMTFLVMGLILGNISTNRTSLHWKLVGEATGVGVQEERARNAANAAEHGASEDRNIIPE